MFEPVTITRSVVAAAVLEGGKRFPCASRAPVGAGDGPCAETPDTMAKNIASRTTPLQDNPQPENWILFMILLGLRRAILKTALSHQCFFCVSQFFLCSVSIIARTGDGCRRRCGGTRRLSSDKLLSLNELSALIACPPRSLTSIAKSDAIRRAPSSGWRRLPDRRGKPTPQTL